MKVSSVGPTGLYRSRRGGWLSRVCRLQNLILCGLGSKAVARSPLLILGRRNQQPVRPLFYSSLSGRRTRTSLPPLGLRRDTLRWHPPRGKWKGIFRDAHSSPSSANERSSSASGSMADVSKGDCQDPLSGIVGQRSYSVWNSRLIEIDTNRRCHDPA